MNNKKNILIFGAGRIGRSFIGQLFGQAGYHIVFADIDQNIINELNRRKSYPVIFKGEKEETIHVKNVSAVSFSNREKVKAEIVNASIMAVSVGKNALNNILPVIAEGLKMRYKANPDRQLNIIIAENMRSAAEFFQNKLLKLLPGEYPLNELVGLIETSIGKMVPIMTDAELKADSLAIFAEPYNTLILDKKNFIGELPDVKGLSFKDNMKAWVDRKAFIHNLGHAASAYFGNFYKPDAEYIYEVLDDCSLFKLTRSVMIQAAEILLIYYPEDFNRQNLTKHIDNLLYRFRNRALKDTIFRVGRDLPRKFGINDRFEGIIQMAQKKNLPYDKILSAMVHGFFFQKPDYNKQLDSKDILFKQTLNNYGVEKTLTELCGFNAKENKKLICELKIIYSELKTIN